jgi:hypothetical protein
MEERGQNGRGPIAALLAEDHRRLDALLLSALAEADRVDHAAYDQFRAGILRHIGMEEKILVPAAQRWRGGKPLPMAAALRLDHGAIASLLMPTPTAGIIKTLRSILGRHNTIEEGSGGLYDICDTLAGPEAEQILTQLHAAPALRVMPYSDTATVLSTVRRAVERAGYRFEE